MGITEQEKKKNRIADAAVFGLLLAAASAATLKLFYGQTLGGVDSDMAAYILEMQGLESRYSFPYPVFFKLAALVHLFAEPNLSVAIATMLLNSLGMIVTKLAFNSLVLPIWGRDSGVAVAAAKGEGGYGRLFHVGELQLRVLLSLTAMSLFFISMLYPPSGIYLPGIKFRYVGVFTANPFHNATYMAARPFAILAFLWFVKLLPEYEKGIGKSRSEALDGKRDYVLFSAFLFVATMTKPSFTLVMVSAAGLFMLYRMFRTRFRNFLPTVKLGVCFLPTFLALLYQYKGVFVPGEGQEGGLGFCVGEVWADYCDNIPLGICLAIGFPLFSLVLNFKKYKKNPMVCFSWLLYLVSFAEAFFLYEKGFRKVDFNFSWGYMYGIFFCHLAALLSLVQDTVREMAAGARKDSAKFPLLLQWLAYLCHLLCGLLYFRDLLLGGTYY